MLYAGIMKYNQQYNFMNKTTCGAFIKMPLKLIKYEIYFKIVILTGISVIFIDKTVI